MGHTVDTAQTAVPTTRVTTAKKRKASDLDVTLISSKAKKKAKLLSSSPSRTSITIPTIRLTNGTSTPVSIPQLGFGTYRLKQAAVKTPLGLALSQSYPLLDTASVYNNEKQIGEILSTRQTKPFITTKLWRSHQGTSKIITQNLQKSRRALNVEKIDLFLLHWPGPGHHRFKKYQVPQNWTPQMRIETWKTMTTFLQTGECRAVGVSNFTIRHLEELKRECEVTPAVNQIECHPFLVQKELREYCKKEGIVIMAYCSLGEGDKKLLTHPVILECADAVEKTPAQVLLRWAVEHGMVVIPCSTSEAHQKENMGIFDWELGKDWMSKLDSLDCGVRYGWKGQDPEEVP